MQKFKNKLVPTGTNAISPKVKLWEHKILTTNSDSSILQSRKQEASKDLEGSSG